MESNIGCGIGWGFDKNGNLETLMRQQSTGEATIH